MSQAFRPERAGFGNKGDCIAFCQAFQDEVGDAAPGADKIKEDVNGEHRQLPAAKAGGS